MATQVFVSPGIYTSEKDLPLINWNPPIYDDIY